MNCRFLTLMLIAMGTVVTAHAEARSDLAVKQPMYTTLQQYYETAYRTPFLDLLLKSYGSAEKLEAVARYDSTKSSAVVLVPSAWRRSVPGWGLYLHVSPENTGYLPKDWEAVLAREKLIGVSPNGIGNDADTALRMRLTLDAMAAAKTEFGLDNKRLFVGGFSGGANIAARLCVEFPDLFRGAVAECKALPLLDVPAAGGVYPGEYTRVPETTWAALRGYNRRWYFGTGTKDFNLPSVTAQEPIWRQLGLEIRTEVVEGLAHQDLPADSFAKALAFIQATAGTNPPTLPVAKTAGKNNPVHVIGAVFWVIPHGTSTTLGGPGKVTVFELSPQSARKELATTNIDYAWNGKRHGLEATYEFKELVLPAAGRLVVEYAMNADLGDGKGMHIQTESVAPVELPNKTSTKVKWREASLKAKKGR